MKMLLRKKIYLIVIAAFCIHSLFIYAKNKPAENIVVAEGFEESDRPVKGFTDLYESLHLDRLGLNKEAFDKGLEGYNYLVSTGAINNSGILSIVDFSKASCKKRLFIIDLKKGRLLFNTYVAHGRNSGREMAKEFSNDAESNKSSLGFYVTGDTYMGKHGFSMRLLGQERGINDNANDRAIVMHSAAYVSEEAIRMQGFAGRSLGCPALPEGLNKPIIEKIKNGTCLFLYSPDKFYSSHSTVLKKTT